MTIDTCKLDIKMYIKSIFYFLSVIMLVGCTTPAVVSKADANFENRAKSFQVEPTKSKVYFVNGNIVPSMFNSAHAYPSDFLINDTVIGSMNKDNVLVVDLMPGSYEFHWMPRSTDLIDKKSVPKKANLQVNGGQILVMRGDYSLGGAAYFGLIGSMVSPPTTSIVIGTKDDIKNKIVVSPQNCNPSICAN